MAHYKVILAYDGTDFQGFQRQVKGRTVQASVEAALRSIGWQNSTILGAGRTDTGVHASGQVIAFEFGWNHSTVELQDALNANLPDDIAAQSVELTSNEFHPRFSATARQYRYRLFCDNVRQPLRERYAWRVWPAVSIELLHETAAYLIGRHDFSAFGSAPQPGGSTIREIFTSTWQGAKQDLVFEILGNAFLYHMVRRLVSFQVEIGQGKRNPDEIKSCLDGKERELVQGLAPAQGLILTEVVYPHQADDTTLNLK
ncbi:MAG: tRNA pseudouridine(38-40) synthase TruA [Chloroflexi bacterium]|nr:tRNA pseudouridine(38-40) synthase TruA [Chloroflexota bacterium]